MMKPGIGSYDQFKQLFEKFSAEAGKKQYLIPYFIAAHPGTSDEDMMNLALWLKKQRLPRRPGADLLPVADGHRDRDVPLGPEPAAQGSARDQRTARRSTSCAASSAAACTRPSCATTTPNNWPLLREALKAMGRADLIGNGKHHLIPTFQPLTDGSYQSARRKNSTPRRAHVDGDQGTDPHAAHGTAAAEDTVAI